MIDLYNFIALIAFYVGWDMFIRIDKWYISLIGVTISITGLQYLLMNFR